MLELFYAWALKVSSKKHALWFLAAISFIESSVFPIPPDVLLIPMVLAAPTKAWRIAFVCTISSVVGGLLGYAIGAFLFEMVAAPMLDFYGYLEKFEDFKAGYNDWGAWIIAGAGVTPFPYKVITIASGAVHTNIVVFVVASICSRAARFFIIAALLKKYGEPMKAFIEKRLGLLVTVGFLLLLAGFAAVKLF
ncbi:MAG: DedA family protein [Alphaproteobacteria bacterium]|nr:DedA family protein [Alphaproteobacteria bacterium]